MRRIYGSGGDVCDYARDEAIWNGEVTGRVEANGSVLCGARNARAHAWGSESAGGVTYVLSPALLFVDWW